MSDGDYRPMMSKERAKRLRKWHNDAYEEQRASLPLAISFMGLDLYVSEDVFAPPESEEGDPFHKAVLAEVKQADRVLDMGTGSGVSAILAAKVSSDVVAVDINPRAVECAIANAERNGVRERITFLQSDVFDAVDGQFDLIVFDPPFRWFAPRDLLEMVRPMRTTAH
jgi:release factor glutamine methyltransferase